MKGNHDLFDLVKSLTKSEKRYFTMYCALQRGEKYYLRIFEEMNLTDSYNEGQLKEKLKGHPVVKHWPVSKKYLYDKILESAQQTKASQDPDSEIGYLLEAYKFLRGKGLTNQAMRYLRKAKKKAKDNDLFTRLYNVLNQEYFDTLYSSRNAADAGLERIIKERKEALRIIENYSFVADIYARQKIWLRLHGNAKNKIEVAKVTSIVRPVFAVRKKDLLSVTAISLYNVALADYYLAIGEPVKALHFLRENIELKMQQAKSKMDVQISELYTYLFLSARNRVFTGFENLLQQFYEFSTKPTFNLTYYIRERWFLLYLMGCYVRGQFGEACDFIKNELTQFTRHRNKMSKWGNVNSCYAIAYSYFGANQMERSMQWVQKILVTDETEIETYTFAKVLQVIILYERGYYDLLEHQLRSLERHFKSRDEHYLKKIRLSNFIRRLISSTDNNKKGLFERYWKEVKLLSKDTAYQNFEVYFDLTAWIESKLQKVPFDKAVQRRFKKWHRS